MDTPAVATHLMENPESFLTPIGSILRKLSLEETPSALERHQRRNEFSRPRPALYNQDDLIELRTRKSIDVLAPGITGWAQINGRDDLPIPVKVEYDAYYLEHKSFLLDLRILLMTAVKVLGKEGVTH
jgi:O-antigen biosynthesis protein WbqP